MKISKKMIVIIILLMIAILYVVFIKKYHLAITYYEVVFSTNTVNQKGDSLESRYEYYTPSTFQQDLETDGFSKDDIGEVNVIIYGRSATLWRYLMFEDRTIVLTSSIGKYLRNNTFDFSEFSEASNLNKIYIFDNSNADTNIKRGNGIFVDNLSTLRGLENLEYLDLSSNFVFVEPWTITHFTNLTHLNISNSNLKDIEHLVELEKLEVLDLSFNEDIVNFEVLYDMDSLTDLYLYKCNVSDEFLANLQVSNPSLKIYTYTYIREKYPATEPYWYE